MTKQPVPDAGLDDRLFFGGTAGSGKTYNAMGRVERLLGNGARVVIPDPLGVWWGLRLTADGKRPSGYASNAGYAPDGGSFNNALSKLRTLELISGRAELKASDDFFG